MRILVISNLFPPEVLGGYEILCHQVCAELKERGHDIHVLTTGTKQPEHATTLDSIRRDLELYQPFGQPPSILRGRRRDIGQRNFAATEREIKRVCPDLIFIWSQLRLTIGAARAAIASGLPVAFTFNDEHVAGYLPAPASFRPRGMAAYLADTAVMPEITISGIDFAHTTCISECLKRNLLKRGVPIASSRVIYQGIPMERFPLKEEPGGLGSPASILYAGQLHAYKAPHTLLEAVELIGQQIGPDAVTVSVAGDGPEEYKKRLRDLADRQPSRVRFLGKVAHDEMPALYRSHDLFVFPSAWQEPFGLTQLEAMASGTPVLSTSDGGHGEVLIHGENAMLFEKEQPRELADHLIALLGDGVLRRTLAANGRRLVEERLSLERYVTDLEAFLFEVEGG